MFQAYNPPKELIPSDPRFGCGPSLIPTSYVDRLRETGQHLLGTSHRKAPIKNLMKETQESLTDYFSLPDDYSIIMGNGGASFLFDMIGLGLVEKKATHFTCGEFSEKWQQFAGKIPWIDVEKRGVEFGQGIKLEDDKTADVICGTLNETSTGVILSEQIKVHKDALLCIDATSGGGQVPWDVAKTDVFFLSPQKVFASEGGLYVAILSPKAKERALRIAGSDRYIPGIMDWKQAIANGEKNQTFTTPSVTSLFFLREQAVAMNSLGYAKVQDLAKEKARHIYGWANEKEYLSPFIKEEEFRSMAVATIDVSDHIDVGALLKRLGDLQMVYGIDSYRKLGRNQFRIGLFHNISLEDLQKLTSLLSHAIESV